MHNSNLLSFYSEQSYAVFDHQKNNWKKLSRFFLVFTFHLLLLTLILTQTDLPATKLTDNAFNFLVLTPSSISNNQAKNTPNDQTSDDHSDGRPDVTQTSRSANSNMSVEAATRNLNQASAPNYVITVPENKTISPESTVKAETPATTTTAIATASTPLPDSTASTTANRNEETEGRIGESSDHIVEIHQIGSSKGIYSMPDLSQPGGVRIAYQVEIGDYPSMELAIVNDIISKIRSRYKKEVYWNSREKARFVKLSTLTQDHAIMEKFLRLEIFGKSKGKDYSSWDKSKF